jgi:uncharacterized protein YkwD
MPIRSIRWLLLLFALGGGFLPTVANSQTSEEEESESHQSRPAKPSPGAQAADLAQVATRLISLTNEFRQAEGLRAVKPNPQLTAAARDFADFMAQTGKYGHTADGSRPSTRAKQHGYDHCVIAENIAYQFSTAGFTAEEVAQGFFQGWKQSPGHRKNMLDPAVTDTGVAVAHSAQTGNYYAVQMFGRPASESIGFQLSNHASAVIQYSVGDRTFSLPPRHTRTHQQCRTTVLTVHWPGGQEQPTVRPKNQDRYAIVQEGGGQFRLQKE